MKEQLYLTFSLDQRRYGINSAYLEEMLPLPEITMLPTVSQDIIGILNLRGDIIPILDLNLSLGHERIPYHTTDKVVILKQSQLRVGLIVSSIGGLETFSTIKVDALDSRIQTQRSDAQRKQMMAGEILSTGATNPEKGDPPCWLLNGPEQWLPYVEIQQLVSLASVVEKTSMALFDSTLGAQETTFYTEASSEERAIFQQRALTLKQPLQREQQDIFSTLAIITIGNAYFGVDLSAIREFTGIQIVTPIPCCPPQIVGNMNLRGDILTLFDIQHCLRPAAYSSLTPTSENPTFPKLSASQLQHLKVMVVEIDQYVVGIVVKDILEAMFSLRQKDMMPPSDVSSFIDKRYLQGGFSYRETTVGILDLPKILKQGNMSIDEVVP